MVSGRKRRALSSRVLASRNATSMSLPYWNVRSTADAPSEERDWTAIASSVIASCSSSCRVTLSSMIRAETPGSRIRTRTPGYMIWGNRSTDRRS
jgi:hypothetical protein